MKRRSTAMNPVFIKDQNTQQLPTIKSEPEESSNLNSNSTNEGTDQNHQVTSESKLNLKDETINSSNLHWKSVMFNQEVDQIAKHIK